MECGFAPGEMPVDPGAPEAIVVEAVEAGARELVVQFTQLR
jgi:hypothetical protein